jgi:uncharacterized protein (TIGR02611 family)
VPPEPREFPRDAPDASGRDGNGPIDRFRRWRDRLRRRPNFYRYYRIVVAVIGLAITIGGLALVPLPGPGWLIVFVGVAVLASEFESARKVERRGKRILTAWTDWLKRQSRPVQLLVGLATAVLVALVIYLVFRVIGVPGWIPDGWVDWLPGLP